MEDPRRHGHPIQPTDRHLSEVPAEAPTDPELSIGYAAATRHLGVVRWGYSRGPRVRCRHETYGDHQRSVALSTFTSAMYLEDAKAFRENVHAQALEWVAMHPEWAKARDRMDAAEWKTRHLRGPFRELRRLAVEDAGMSSHAPVVDGRWSYRWTVQALFKALLCSLEGHDWQRRSGRYTFGQTVSEILSVLSQKGATQVHQGLVHLGRGRLGWSYLGHHVERGFARNRLKGRRAYNKSYVREGVPSLSGRTRKYPPFTTRYGDTTYGAGS